MQMLRYHEQRTSFCRVHYTIVYIACYCTPSSARSSSFRAQVSRGNSFCRWLDQLCERNLASFTVCTTANARGCSPPTVERKCWSRWRPAVDGTLTPGVNTVVSSEHGYCVILIGVAFTLNLFCGRHQR